MFPFPNPHNSVQVSLIALTISLIVENDRRGLIRLDRKKWRFLDGRLSTSFVARTKRNGITLII